MSEQYFKGLNYTLGNEDTSLEIDILSSLPAENVFAVCGSGGRSLPLIGLQTKTISIIDLSKEQLSLAKLRMVTYQNLEHDDFLLFWGYYPYSPERYCSSRKALFTSLKSLISEDVYNFFEQVFRSVQFQGLLYLGKWEKVFKFFAKINQKILGKNFDQILHFDSLEDQRIYFQEKFPQKRFQLVLKILGNKSLFNALLYKGHFIKKNSPLSHFEYYQGAYRRIMENFLCDESFFMHLSFYGEIRSFSGVPVEARQKAFMNVKKFQGQYNFLQENLMDHLSRGIKSYDFLSLSDVPSYFSGELEQTFMQKIKPSLAPNAILVNRYYLRTPDTDLSDFEDITHRYESLIRQEKVQMYNIKIYQFKG